jgi:hypothetical protein
MRAWKWYIKYPNDAYALGPFRFQGNPKYHKPPNEREVRDYTRKWSGAERLPAGFQCWPAEN